MPVNEEPKEEESTKDKLAAELEKKSDEIPAGDADTISGGWGKFTGGDE